MLLFTNESISSMLSYQIKKINFLLIFQTTSSTIEITQDLILITQNARFVKLEFLAFIRSI